MARGTAPGFGRGDGRAWSHPLVVVLLAVLVALVLTGLARVSVSGDSGGRQLVTPPAPDAVAAYQR